MPPQNPANDNGATTTSTTNDGNLEPLNITRSQTYLWALAPTTIRHHLPTQVVNTDGDNSATLATTPTPLQEV